MELRLRPLLSLLGQRGQRFANVREGLVALGAIVHRPLGVRVDDHFPLGTPQAGRRLRRVDRPGPRRTNEALRRLGNLHGGEDIGHLLRVLGEPTKEGPLRPPYLLDDRLPDQTPVHNQ